MSTKTLLGERKAGEEVYSPGFTERYYTSPQRYKE